MNTELNKSSLCFGAYADKKIIGFCAVLTQPHAIVKRLKRIHRCVVLPDWQGVGIGKNLLSFVGAYYKSIDYKLSLVTSAKNLVFSLRNSELWKLLDIGRNSPHGKKTLRRTTRTDCRSARFIYVGKEDCHE